LSLLTETNQKEPIVKSGFRNTRLSAHFLYPGAGFSLFQGKRYLFFGITCLFYVRWPLFSGEERPETLLYTGTEEREEISTSVFSLLIPS